MSAVDLLDQEGDCATIHGGSSGRCVGRILPEARVRERLPAENPLGERRMLEAYEPVASAADRRFPLVTFSSARREAWSASKAHG